MGAESGGKLMAPAKGEWHEGKHYGHFEPKPLGYHYGPDRPNYGRTKYSDNIYYYFCQALPDFFWLLKVEKHYYFNWIVFLLKCVPFIIFYELVTQRRYRLEAKGKESH